MTPRQQHRRDHTRPEARPDDARYDLGSRERMSVRPLTADEVRRARLTVAGLVPRQHVAEALDALGIGARLEVVVEGAS